VTDTEFGFSTARGLARDATIAPKSARARVEAARGLRRLPLVDDALTAESPRALFGVATD
jgi:hypothetical protein